MSARFVIAQAPRTKLVLTGQSVLVVDSGMLALCRVSLRYLVGTIFDQIKKADISTGFTISSLGRIRKPVKPNVLHAEGAQNIAQLVLTSKKF